MVDSVEEMKIWGVFVGLAALLAYSAASEVGSIFDPDFQKQFGLFDEDDLRDFTPTELEGKCNRSIMFVNRQR